MDMVRGEAGAGSAGGAWRSRAGVVARWGARALMIYSATLGLWYETVQGIGEWQQMHRSETLLVGLVVLPVMIALLWAAWRWELVGGILIVVVFTTVASVVHFRYDSTFHILQVRPVLAGALLIASGLLNRRPCTAHPVAT